MSSFIRKTTLAPSERRRELIEAFVWTARSSLWSPPTDVYETEDAYIVRVEVAGMRNARFEITLENGILHITGVRPDVAERRAYHQMEIRFGRFSTSVALPETIQVELAQAEYDDGFLTIILPKHKPIIVEIQK